ncbi:MAG TPA: hypothetical protein VG322_08970 [Candidatus Acidoferrales bacterium]|nr:hypothetical protein [Candidatus Acidoferrales bacterium]
MFGLVIPFYSLRLQIADILDYGGLKDLCFPDQSKIESVYDGGMPPALVRKLQRIEFLQRGKLGQIGSIVGAVRGAIAHFWILGLGDLSRAKAFQRLFKIALPFRGHERRILAKARRQRACDYYGGYL